MKKSGQQEEIDLEGWDILKCDDMTTFLDSAGMLPCFEPPHVLKTF